MVLAALSMPGAGRELSGTAINSNLVSSIAVAARSRLVTIGTDALIADAARRLSDTQISLAVVCDRDGVMKIGYR